MYDICIIGAGVLGAFLAHLLAHTTAQVLCLEREPDVARGRTALLSNLLSPPCDAETPPLKTHLIQQGISVYPQICRNLSVPFRYTPPPDCGMVDPLAISFALAEEAVLNQVDLHLSQEVVHLQMLQNATSFLIQTSTQTFHSRFVINTTAQHFPLYTTENERLHIDPIDDFFVGRLPLVSNLIRIVISDDAALAAAPAIAAYVAEEVLHIRSAFGKKPFFLHRHPPLNLKYKLPSERNQYVHTHPEAGRIICRCCQITEAEILDIIRRPVGARDFDGVKRRLGVGSGLCQGGRCRVKIEALLVKEALCKKQNW